MLPLLLILIGPITVSGDSVATALVTLDSVMAGGIDPYAYFMSVGPPGPCIPDTIRSDDGEPFMASAACRRLRVTLYSCERSVWIAIDDILTGRADGRSVTARYNLSIRDLNDLRVRPKRFRLLRPIGEEPTIIWQSPSAFAMPTREDTLFIEHKDGHEFRIEVRARMDEVTMEEYNRLIDSLKTYPNGPE
jgi:hypothetical protein